MNFKRILLSITCLFCTASSQLFAQTRDTGHEIMRGEMNFTDMANYYIEHPEPLVVKDEENDDDDSRPAAAYPITDSSLIRRRVTSMYTPSAPVTGGAFLPISPAPNDTFESTIDNETTIPPDTHGAVDSNYCMTTINSTVRIQTRAGVTVSSVSLNAFFSPLVSSGVYDPRVHYDMYTHRWIFVADYGAEATTSSLLIAISETSNPTGSWYEFKVTADGTGVNWLDFPEVGFNGKWITVTGNMFTVATSAYSEVKMFVFNKANLLAGTSATYTSFTVPGAFTFCPTLTYSATEQSMFLVQNWNAGAGYLQLLKITGAVGSEVLDTIGYPSTSQLWQEASFQNSDTAGADFAPQTGTSKLVQTNDDRFDQMIFMNGNLWFAHTIFLPYSATANPTRSSIQWWETDTTGTPIQLGNIDDATGTNFYAFPSLAVNSLNDVLIGFAAFSGSIHPSGAYALRYHTDPTDSIRPLQIFRHGQNTYYKTYSGTKNRWGDYSGAVMDILNQTDFWTIQEASSSTANDWDTWWAQVTLCTAPAGITGTATVCAGSTTTLADATTGGTWTSGSTATATVGSTTGIVSGVATGTVTISYSTGSNCFSTSIVTVNPLPSAIGGSTPVCAGSTVTLTETTTGGSWASGTTTVATVGTGAGVVTAVAAGTSIISYTLSSTGCRVTSAVTVNSLPATVSASSAFCAGTTITLTDGTTGGTWSSGGTSIATVVSGTGVVTGVAGGTATITYTLGTGCIATTVVTVNSSPVAITGSVAVCAASTITLANTTTGGTWSSGTTTVATVGTGAGVVTAVSAGTSIISYTLSDGCRATSIVTVNALPATIPVSSAFCAGSTITLTDGTTGGTWSSGTTTVATVVGGTGVVTGVLSGTSVITYSLGTGCTANTIVTVNTTPATIPASSAFCAGATITLTDGTTGGTWSSGNTAVATVVSGTGVVTGVSSGTAVISYTLSTGGCFTTSIVTVNALPATISTSTAFCASTTITLTDGTTGGTWSSGTTTVATVVGGTGVVTGVLSGTSVITYSLGTGCTATTIVTVNTTPATIPASSAFCAGATITLTDGTTGGTWSSGNTAVATVVSGTGVVTGVSSGTAVISYTLSTGGCFTTSIVTVNALPATIPVSSAFCAGSTITLTDGTTGGTWSSGTTTVATVVGGTGVVTGVLSGTSVIIYSLGTGCTTTTIVTVNTTPATIPASSAFCAGSTITLTDGISGGTWSSGTTTVATVVSGSGVVTGVLPGTSLIVYALSTGCLTTTVVTVTTTPSAISTSSPFCVGSTITLTDGITGGTWSSGTTTVATVVGGTGVVTGVLSGTSVITYSLGTGCTATTIVTVNTTPATIPASSAFCAGATITLTDGTTGGTWSSGNTAVATVVSGTGVVTGVSSGTAVISYTLSTGGCFTTSIVTVNALPATIPVSSAFCAGSTITLTDGITGGTWSSGTTTVATVVGGTGVVTGVLSGTSVITYSLGTGCTATTIVTVNTTPATIPASSAFCAGATITLTDGTTGGTWSSGNTAVATVVSGTGVVTGVSSGTAVISYTLSTGGCFTTSIVTVNALPATIPVSSAFCAGSTITLTDGTTGGTWSSGTTTVATVVGGTGVVTGVLSGTSVIIYSLGTGCTTTTIVTVNTTPATIPASSAFCAGSTITLTDGISGGTWSSGTTTVATVVSGSGVVTGVLPGTSLIVYALSTGCLTTTVVTVTTTPSAISTSSPFCVGSTITLTDGITGGTWSSGTTTVATVIGGTGVVTGVLSGTSVITYSLGTGCTATTIVTVNTTPATIPASSAFCAGATITLTDGTTGGTWSSGNTAVATVVSGTGVVTGVSSGTAVISYTLSTGGCFTTSIVTVNALPATIPVSSAFCAGSTITLTDGITGGTWSSGTTTVATVVGGTGVVTGVLSGTSVITYSLGTGCTATTIVTVNTTPATIPASSAFCAGATITLTDGTTGGTWSSGNTAVATVVSGTGVVTGVSSGTAVISYTLSIGGCFTTSIVTVNALPATIPASSVFCAGSTITLTDGTTGGTWSSGTTTVATVIGGTGVVTGVLSGTSIITYSLGTGCTANTIVTVNTTPATIPASSAFCAGSTITLTDGTTGGTWSSSTTTVATVVSGTGVVTGVSGGTSIISYTLGTGCKATSVITVNSLPATISASSAFCAGSTITLTDGVTGGTWSSGTTTVATVVGGAGVVTGVLSGTSIITYSLGTGCNTTTIVTVNTTPATIPASTAFCAGSTITLTDGISGGTWSSGNTAVATVISGSGVVTGVSSGTAVISYTLSTGGCFTTSIVTVNALPATIPASSAFCAGSTITLTDGTTGGTWSSGTTTVATVVGGTGVVTGVLSGTSIITYSLGTGCTATTIVTVNTTPATIPASSAFCAGATITLTDGTTGGTWSSGNTAVATVVSGTGVVTGVSSGTAVISYTLSTGGCFTTSIVTLNALPATIPASSAFCAGSTITLTDGTTGGTWSSGTTTVATVVGGAGVVTGVLSGTSIITYSLGTGCNTTTIVTVNTTPATIPASTAFCAGSTITLTDGISGGTWSSGNTAVATVISGSGVVTGVLPGTSLITYALSTGCLTTTVVTVTTTPSAISTSSPFCAGSTISLTDGITGGTWSSGTTTVATVVGGTGVVTGVLSGTSVITYSLGTGCTATTIVTVNTTPATVPASSAFCAGSTITLTDGTTGGTWSSGTTTVATVVSGSGVVTGVSSGTAVISYTLSIGGCFTTSIVTVNALPATIPASSAFCAGSTITLTDGTTGGTWSSGTTTVATVVGGTGVVTGVLSGTSVITYSLGTGCTATTIVTVNTTPATIPASSAFCAGATITLTDGTTGGTWSSGNTAVATVVSGTGVVTGVSSGTAVISYTLSIGGCFTTSIVTVNALPATIPASSAFCAGSTITLTDGTTGGTWSSGTTTVATVIGGTGVVTGVLSGTSVITYSLGTGCTATTIVTVNTTPATIPASSAFCAGSTITLTDGTTGGTWSSGTTTVATVVSGSGVVTGVLPGTSLITYALSTGCLTTTVVTVTTTPSAISTSSPFCAGSTITLTDGITGGTWSSGTTTVATVVGGTGVVTGVLSGTSIITYSLGTGCTATTIVTVNTTPATIPASSAFCAGATITLTDGTTGGTWSSGNTAVATVVSGTGVVTGVSSGTAVISYTLSTGGCFATSIVTVNALPATIPASSAFCAGSTITLTDGTTGGTWSSGTTTVATVVGGTGVVTGVLSGTSVITYSLGTGCTATTIVTVNTTPATIPASSAFCAGATITLTDGTTGGTWSSGNTAVATVVSGTGVVTGVSSGTAVISYTLSIGGCFTTSIVTVNALPATIPASSAFCAGSTITLTDGTTGGTWSSGTTTVATVIGGTGVVTGVLSGTSVITYSLGTGCTATTIVTVNTTPATIPASSAFCAGSTITLTDGTTGGTWSSGTTTVATVVSGSGVVTGVSSGTAVISYTLSIGGCFTTSIVTVNALPATIPASSAFCAGSTITLTDGTTGGTWSSGTTTVATVIGGTGVVTGVLSGTSVITYSLGTGCTATTIVTVNTTPATIPASSAFCAGSTITLTDGTTGGTWSSGTTTVATVVSGSGVVTGVLPGTSLITYALSTGCLTTTVVTVTTTPSAISTSSPFCAGSTITLTDGITGGTWSSGTTTVATVVGGTGVVTGVLSGTSIITYSLGTGCTATTIVTVNTTPATIPASSAFCAGATITLTDGTTGGTWSSGNTAVATVVSGTGVVTGVSSGTAVISYTLSTGGCFATSIVTVNALPATIPASSAFCAGSTITLTDGTTGGTWSSGTTTVATVVGGTGVVTGVLSGTSVITYSLGTGCTATTIVTVNTTPATIPASSAFCAGSTITLTDGTTGGTWSSGTTTVATVVSGSGVVTGVLPGTSLITYALSTGCLTTTVVTVTTTPSAISTSSPFCAGSTITLTDGITGGTWSSGTTTVATVVGGAGVVTGVLSGTSIITYSLGTGCNTTTIVTVNTTPATIPASTAFCAGSTITLTDGISGGTWSSGNTAVATVISGSGVVTGVLPGTSLITYALSTGCLTTTVVTVTTTPSAISPSSPFCAGSTITLTDGITGGTWSSGTTTVATVAGGTGVVTGVLSGTSVITYSLGTGCTATTIVTVNTTPATVPASSAFCAGSTITLTDGTTGGTWSSGTTTVATVLSSSGVVTGVLPGTSLITYALSTGCLTTTVVTVTTTPSAISPSSPFCAGSTITLTDGITGGTWSSGTTTVATVVGGTGVVTGVLSGTSIITYSLGTGCTATTIVTVNTTPATIPASSAFCAGATITLTDGTTGGTWSSGNTAVATVVSGTGVVTGVSSGTAVISYTLSTGGCFATSIVTVNALPATIPASSAFCAGSTITLTDGTTGGTWSSGSTTIATVITASGVVAGVASGTSTITYALVTGCHATAVVTVNSLPLAISGAGQVCLGSTITLGDLTTGGTWTSNNTAIATVIAGTGVVTGTGPGSATITYTISTGCSATAIVTINPLPNIITGGTTVCTGSTRLLADATTGGTWSSSSAGIATIVSTGVVTGSANGTATITYTIGTGCYVTSPIADSDPPLAIAGSAAVCVGSTITLADVTSGGTWSSSGTTTATINAGGVVTGAAAGTATISYTLGTGCFVTSHVTINPLPSVITGGTTVCVTGTRSLADVTTGGTWSSSSTGTATVASSGNVSGVSTGTSIITYALATGCYVVSPLTVNPLPPVITGGPAVCIGSTTALADATTGGTWSSSATSAATVNGTGTVSGVALGSATISYTLSSGCFVTSQITVDPLPAIISGSASVCTGLSTVLSDATSGGTWSSNNTSVASVGPVTGMVIAGGSPGTATITYTIATGCTTSVIVTVNSVPSVISGPGSVCIGSTIALSDLGTGTWSSSNTSVATVVTGTGTVTGIISGTASITYSVASGCSATATITVNALPPSITGVSSVCVGSTTTLSNGTTGGTWSSSNTATTIDPALGTINGITAGTTVISYTAPTGCVVTKALTVNPLPSVVTGLVAVCAGSTITLGDASTGGTWNSSNTAVASIAPLSGIVTGITPGTSVITYALSTGCTATAIVTVSITPAAIFGLSAVCPGTTITLSDATTGGTWSTTSTTATIDPASGDVTGITSGTASVTYTVGSCAAIRLVTINPVSSVTGVTSVCQEYSASLTPGLVGGTWSSSNTAIATVNAPIGIFSGVSAGTAVITYTLITGCITTTIVTVNPLPDPISGIAHVCQGATTTLSDAITGGTWSSSSTATASISAATGVVTGVAPGSTVVTYSLGSGCIVIATVTVNAIPAAISGTASVCQGLTTSLGDGGTGAWSSSNTSVATVIPGTGSVSGVTPGTATVSFTFTSGCAASAVVTVNVTPVAISGPAAVCMATSVALSDATTGGSWSTVGTVATVDASGNVTGISAGAAAISYTLGSCTTTIAITVNPVSAITGTGGVCPGSTITLTDAVTGGLWSSANTAVATANLSTGVVSGVAPGTAILTYTSPAGCLSSTTITVNSLPASITGVAVVCAGSSGTLLDATTGGGWTSGNTSVATINAASGSFTGIAAGTAAITYTNSAGCITATIITINPLPSPIATAESSVCTGFTLSLSDPGSGAWSSSNTAVITIDGAGLLTSLSPGATVVTYTLSTGCVATISITVDPLPAAIAGDGFVCIGGTVELSDTGSGTWSSSDGTVATVDASGNVYGLALGTVTITYTLSTGCFSTAIETVSACPGSGVNQIISSQGNISILPNPNKGEFTITGVLNTTTDEEVSLEIFDLLGQTVYKNNIMTQGGKFNEHIKLNASTANGTYLLNLWSGTDNHVFHIIVEQ